VKKADRRLGAAPPTPPARRRGLRAQPVPLGGSGQDRCGVSATSNTPASPDTFAAVANARGPRRESSHRTPGGRIRRVITKSGRTSLPPRKVGDQGGSVSRPPSGDGAELLELVRSVEPIARLDFDRRGCRGRANARHSRVLHEGREIALTPRRHGRRTDWRIPPAPGGHGLYASPAPALVYIEPGCAEHGVRHGSTKPGTARRTSTSSPPRCRHPSHGRRSLYGPTGGDPAS